MFIMSSQTQPSQKRVQVGSLTNYHRLSNGGLTHFAHKLIARNHQQKTLVVARIMVFAHREFPPHRELSFNSSCRNFVFAAHVRLQYKLNNKSGATFKSGFIQLILAHYNSCKESLFFLLQKTLLPTVRHTNENSIYTNYSNFYFNFIPQSTAD